MLGDIKLTVLEDLSADGVLLVGRALLQELLGLELPDAALLLGLVPHGVGALGVRLRRALVAPQGVG